MTTITLEAYDVIVLMRAGLGSNKIAQALGIAHPAVLRRQDTLEAKGIISKGTMNGERRQILHDNFQVEPEYRQTTRARAKQLRIARVRNKNLARARAIRAQQLAQQHTHTKTIAIPA